MPDLLPIPADISPTAFFESAQGQAWIEAAARDVPHARYDRSYGDSFSLRDLNAYASAALQASRGGLSPLFGLEERLAGAELWDTWHHELSHEAEAVVGQRADAEEWLEAIRAAWEDAVSDADDSSVADLFTSHDRCELLFPFSTGEYLIDHLIECHTPWPDPAELAVTENLQHALRSIGFTVSQFRKAMRNHHESHTVLVPAPRRRSPIVTIEALREIIENSCSRSFLFTLFTVAPITDVLALDPARPITFTRAWLATMDPINGTFFDTPIAGPITVTAADGRLISAHDMAYSPDDICSPVLSHYHGNIANAPTAH